MRWRRCHHRPVAVPLEVWTAFRSHSIRLSVSQLANRRPPSALCGWPQNPWPVKRPTATCTLPAASIRRRISRSIRREIWMTISSIKTECQHPPPPDLIRRLIMWKAVSISSNSSVSLRRRRLQSRLRPLRLIRFSISESAAGPDANRRARIRQRFSSKTNIQSNSIQIF